MTETGRCSQCNTPIRGRGVQGLCPVCLARTGFALEEMPSPEARGSSIPVPARRPRLRYLGDYELIDEIARGGGGVVYRARQISLNRVVAVKMLPFSRQADEEFIRRLKAEAEAAANLQHPNIVAIHEVGEHEGQHYFSMDYVEGKNLAHRTEFKPLPPKQAANYLRTIAEAIHYAHQRGVLHRDLKPSNILIDAFNQPRITDFGLAKRMDSQSDLTITGQIMGTPQYMSPEQARGRGREVTTASDLYSLGAILYFLLAGRPPFQAETLEGVLHQLMHDEPVSLRQWNPTVPRDLETICLKCLEKEPHKRYGAAQELADELDRFLRGEPILARPISAPGRLWRWCQRKPVLAVTGAALLLVGMTGLAGILWQWSRAERHASRETAERTMLELQRVEGLLEKDEVIMGMAYLARIVRQQPTNHIATLRLLSALTQRNFALPVGLPMRHDRRVWCAEISPDGRRIATASADFAARVWDSRTGEPLTAPMLHSNIVRVAYFSPDGERLLTFADDFRAYLWEVETGRAFGQPMAHSGQVYSAQFSPDGQRVLTASADGTARVWSAQTGEPVLQPLRHQGAVNWARFSPDGQRLVTASEDKTAQLWDAQTGRAVGKPLMHHKGVRLVEFSPNNKWIVTAAEDSSTCVWDAASGEPLARPLQHKLQIEAVKFSPDGERILVSSSSGTARILGARDWAPLTRPMQHLGRVTAAEFGPEAQRVLTASIDNTARLWDAEGGDALFAPMQHDGLIWHARFSPNGLFVVTASADTTARIWDVRRGRMLSQAMRHLAPVVAAEFSPDGTCLISSSWDGRAMIWNLRSGQARERPLQHGGPIPRVEFSPDGQRVATASHDGTARIWDVATSEPLTEPLMHGAPVERLRFSPDGQILATASFSGPGLRLWNVRTGKPQGEPVRHSPNIHSLSFSPDGRRLLCDDFGRDVGLILDVESHRLLLELIGHQGYIIYGEFSPDGQRVLTASEDGTARIWDTVTGKELFESLRHKGLVSHARFSPDGRRIVTASHDATAQVWNANNGQPVGERMRHRSQVNTAEFSRDGLLVVTASDDGTVRLWDAMTGRPVSEPFEHHDKVLSARFSRDGSRVLTAALDGHAHVWDVPPAISFHRSPVAGSLLADLAESVLGKRVNPQGALESVSPTSLTRVQQRVAGLPRDADFTRWLEWFFADRSTRTISPYSEIGMRHYVGLRSEETNVVSWREALMLCPTNGSAFSRLAGHHLFGKSPTNSPDWAVADWASQQAVRFAPADASAWWSRQSTLERAGAWAQLLGEANATLQSYPTNASAWNARARAFEGLREFEQVLSACDRGLADWDVDPSVRWNQSLRRDLLRKRIQALKTLGRLAEASAENAAAWGFPPRDPQAGSNLIDLGAFYAGGQGFPGNIQRLMGTDFDLRGWIHLRGHLPEIADLPERVDDIPIQQECRSLHFLHTLSLASHVALGSTEPRKEKLHVAFGAVVGKYVIHYADGHHVDVPIIHGRDVRDYYHWPESLPDDPALVVAWTGSTPGSLRSGATTRLYKSTWENPRPGVPIRSLDIVHAGTHAVPILVAITAEP